MGRVSRYKRVKSCDPFYRGPKKDLDKGHNLPPKKGSDSQSMSRSFREFLMLTSSQKGGSANNNNNKSTEKNSDGKKSIVQSEESTKKRKKKRKFEDISELKNDEDTESVVSDTLEYKRAPGESTEQYLLRVDHETNQRLLSAHRKVKTTSARRKEYLKKRKLKSKIRKSGIKLDDIEGMDFKDLQDHVKFGEVVSAPPNLSLTKVKQPQRKELLLCDKLYKTQRTFKDGGLKKQQDIEEEREKVINLYRQIKKQKQNLLNKE